MKCLRDSNLLPITITIIDLSLGYEYYYMYILMVRLLNYIILNQSFKTFMKENDLKMVSKNF